MTNFCISLQHHTRLILALYHLSLFFRISICKLLREELFKVISIILTNKHYQRWKIWNCNNIIIIFVGAIVECLFLLLKFLILLWKKSLKIIAINGSWSLNFMIINYYYHEVVRNSALIYLKKNTPYMSVMKEMLGLRTLEENCHNWNV